MCQVCSDGVKKEERKREGEEKERELLSMWGMGEGRLVDAAGKSSSAS